MKFRRAVSLLLLSLNVRVASSSKIRGVNSSADVEEKCPVFTDNPNGNDDLIAKMIAATKPCGYYKSNGCDYEVIEPNVDHPGEGTGDLEFIPYIVQFDIGVNSIIKDRVIASYKSYGKGSECLGCGQEGEQCLELIVKGGSAATGGCAGKCGPDCNSPAGYAKDCMKHDLCSAYKSLVQRSQTGFQLGFCYDVDCGDEAAQTVMNCFIDKRFWRDPPITCQKGNFVNPKAYGHWSRSTWIFDEGACHNFVNWSSGQGLPDKSRIRNPYEYLAYLESKGVDISGGYPNAIE